MKSFLILSMATWFALAQHPLRAQDEPQTEPQTEPQVQVHPLLTAKYIFSAGIFFPEKQIELSARGATNFASRGIDFDESVRGSESENVGLYQLRWNFGEKWWVEGEFFNTDTDNTYTLDKDVSWQDLTFKAGSFARLGTDMELARVFFGREFLRDRPRDKLAFGIGLHWVELEAFVEGQIETNVGDTEFARADAGTGFPLPNLGMTYMRSLSPRWALRTRVDWLSLSLDEYSGRLWNANIAINFAITRNIGAELSYMYFDVDGSIKDPPDWRGKADVVFDGPTLKLNANW